MDDHRQAANIGERFPRQSGRRHPGRDDDDCISMVDHRLSGGRGKLDRPPYTYCDGLEKQLVSARFKAQGDRDASESRMIDSWTFNKIAGAVLGTALVVFGLNELSGIIFATENPEKPGFAIEVAEVTTGGEATAATEEKPLAELLAVADVAKGEAAHKKCLACHDFAQDGPNKTGPNLWDVVERPIASHEGFAYSDALKAHSADKWTYENLFTFLNNPKGFAPGTKMVLAVKSPAERANILAYLRSLSATPKPFPTAQAPAAETP